MTTSLASQLRRLALPESSQQSDKRKKVSLLFDSSEAAKLDRDAFYEIGVDGLKSLIKLQPAFELFSDTLFDVTSKNLERTVETKDVNKNLDKNIKKFLKLLSPYLLLKQSHKALEWLICRFQIHEFNIDGLVGLILPYHETKIFVKILQLINLNSPYCTHWKWLEKIQKTGVHLPKSVLVNHALSDSSFLRFICDTMMKTTKENQKHHSTKKLGTLFTFYSVTVCNIVSRKEMNDQHVTVILPSLMAALTSDIIDLKAAGFMVAGQLIASNQFTDLLLDKNLKVLLNETKILKKEHALLLLLIFQSQQPPPNISAESVNKLTWLGQELISLSSEKFSVGPLLLELMRACLDCIVQSNVNVVDAQVLAYTLATEVNCELPYCKSLLWMIDSTYEELLSTSIQVEESSSGLQDLQEHTSEDFKNTSEADENSSSSEYLPWIKELMSSTLEKYKDTFNNDKKEEDFTKLLEKWKAPGGLLIQEKFLADLIKKCQDDKNEGAWLQLRPLLLEKINNEEIFQALCSVAPFYDNLVLLLCLEKFLNPEYSNFTKLSRLNKIMKSKFGGNNYHIKEISNLLTKNKTEDVSETIELYFLKQQKESENSIEFEPWLATLQELRQISKIPAKNEIWSLGLKVLLVALPTSFSATYALQLLSLVTSLKRNELKIRFELLQSLINYLAENKSKAVKWYDLTSQNSDVWLKIRILEYIIEGVYTETNFKSEYNLLLDSFSKTCFYSQQDFILFLSSVCCGLPSPEVNPPEYRVSLTLQIYSLHLSWSQLKINDEKVFSLFRPVLTIILCHLLICLSNKSAAIRKASLKVLEVIMVLLKTHKLYSEAVIFDKLFERVEEISADGNQVSVSLYCLLSPSESVQGTLQQHTAASLSRVRNSILETITAQDTPLYISQSILQLMDNVNSPEIIEKLTKLANEALLRSKESEIPRMILSNFWQRVNESTCQVLEKEHVWELATKSINHDKCDTLCPAVSFLKCISRELFENLSDKRKFQVFECMIAARSDAQSTASASAITSVVKKVCLDCQLILPIISQMITLFGNVPKRRENTKTLQPIIIETKEWKNGISLLELIQSKKKLINSSVLIKPLFSVLKFCLDQEEQTTFEYTKQLVLGCLLDCCKKLSTEDANFNENNMNVELVIQCLRASPNPQTHHHALMLLSYLSALIPNQVMHNVMAIFTFMGTSVARFDDEHSVKIVTQVVDAVVPALVKAINSKNDNLQTVIAEILRVFVWALKDIPPHRQKPLLLQLLNTLQPENSLWIFLLLLLENHVLQGDSKGDTVNIPPNHHLGLQLCISLPPPVVLSSIVEIINYLMRLPVEKMNREGHTLKLQTQMQETKKDGLFDTDAHTPKQLRHFSYTVLVFLNTLLGDNNFILQIAEASNAAETSFKKSVKETLTAVMSYLPYLRKRLEKQQTKFWKGMVHQCNELMDKFVFLLPNITLLSTIKKLLNHSMKSIRRKALDLLNSLLQSAGEDFTSREKESLQMILEPILNVIKEIGEEDEQEMVLFQQTALLAIKLLAKVLSSDHLPEFKKILITICSICKSKTIAGPLLGSIMLAVAELVSCLRSHAVSELPSFMPLMLEIFSDCSNPEKFNELLLNSITLAIHRVVDVLPNFLSPYLDKILMNVCIVSVKAQDKPDLIKKLTQIRQKLGSSVEHRVLIPAISRSYLKLIELEEYEATGPLFSILSSSFAVASDVSKVVPDVTQFFLSTLSFRSDCEINSKDLPLAKIDEVEGNIIEALIPFVLKLSESLFKPFYYQIFHWAAEHKDRSITFFRLSHSLAESLKGLFILFAGHFLQKAAHLLDATNSSKTEVIYFGNTPEAERKAIILLEFILKTLNSVFLYDSSDSSNFLNKDKFEVLLHPLVDQLENTLGGIEELEARISSLITPCLAQMALATDDTLWKSLNYQVLLKSKSILPQVRIGALETIVAIATKLGDDYLMLLPETIGSLAELLEDEDERVENAMKNAIQRLEEVLGQPIKDYFQ